MSFGNLHWINLMKSSFCGMGGNANRHAPLVDCQWFRGHCSFYWSL